MENDAHDMTCADACTWNTKDTANWNYIQPIIDNGIQINSLVPRQYNAVVELQNNL